MKKILKKICKNHLDKYDECDNCPLGKILKNHSCSYENFEKLKEKWEDMEIEVEECLIQKISFTIVIHTITK